MSKTKHKWVKFRHKVVRVLFGPFFYLGAKIKYHAEIEKYTGDKNKPVIVLFNHVTAYDQFFVSLSFKRHIYYVAIEDLFTKGFISSLLRFLVAPIPIKKHSTDLKALKSIVNVAKEGGSIGIAPEGNRTYSGRTCSMKDTVSNLCMMLKLPIVLYLIEGGYGVQPRWSDKVRKGRMRCRIARVIEPEEYLSWSKEELYEVIKNTLTIDEAKDDARFVSKRSAEFLERAMYVCPDCGLSVFESKGEYIKCQKCDKKIKYNEDTSLSGVGFDFPYKFVADWYDHQEKFVNELDLLNMSEESLYEDEVEIYDVEPAKRKKLLSPNAVLKLYAGGVKIKIPDKTTVDIPFRLVKGSACVGNNKLNIEYDGRLYLFKGNERFNPLKYVNFYYRYNNLIKGDEDGKFLGL